MKNLRKLTILSSIAASALLFVSCDSNKKTEDMVVQESSKSNKDIVLENIHSRKSVRKFVADKPVSEEDLEALMRVAMAGPSGMNKQPWEILVVDDRETLNKLAEALPYAKMLGHAPMAIIVCGDTSKSSYWYLDCSAASQNILLAAESMGLGATWTATYPYDDRIAAVKSAVAGIPDNVVPLNVIPVGYPDGEHLPKDKYDAGKVHRNKW